MADETRIVPATEILEKIQRGDPVEYDNVIVEGNLDLSTLDLPTQQVERTKFEVEVLNLSETAKIVGSSIRIMNSEIKGGGNFSNIILQKCIDFRGTQFTGGNAHFMGAKFEGYANFLDAKFGGGAFFWSAKFGGDVILDGAEFEDSAYFMGAKFGGDVILDGAKFNGEVLTFRNAVFAKPGSQEDACRRAKNVLEKVGNREEAGYHFYREMEGRRKSKGIDYEYFDYEILLSCKLDEKELQAIQSRKLTSLRKYVWYNKIEYFLFQLIFGYGVHPLRLWGWWFFFVFLFATIYWRGKGVNNPTTDQTITDPLAYIWFSITVAVTPGFAGYKPATGWYQLLAGLEAIFGTFMWAAFITTFARKYMR